MLEFAEGNANKEETDKGIGLCLTERREVYGHNYGSLRNMENTGYAENVDVSEHNDTHFTF